MRRRVLPVLAVSLFAAIPIVAAQQSQDTFEVASVKANKSGDTNGLLRMLPGGRVSAQNMPVRPIITYAYQLAPFQLIGGPGWLATDRYDIAAKVEGNPASVLPTAGQPDPMMLAMRGLLADRFKLKTHREMREMDIYALPDVRDHGRPRTHSFRRAAGIDACAGVLGAGGPHGRRSHRPDR